MKCEIIHDLLPLYADDVCSEESAKEIKQHLKECEKCKEQYLDMKSVVPAAKANPDVTKAKRKFKNRTNTFSASVLLSACMLAAFLMIVYGVRLEASTPTGSSNGIAAFWIIVPATGFMLSLLNWHFVRFYESLRSFVISSAVLCSAVTFLLFLWSVDHYELCSVMFTSYESFASCFRLFFARGLIFDLFLSTVSAGASLVYARLLGKE